MRVRVMLEFLIPGVEHAEEADLGAEMFGITSDLEERFGTGLQQQMEMDFLVVQSELRQIMGLGEDNKSVTGRQKILVPILEHKITIIVQTMRITADEHNV